MRPAPKVPPTAELTWTATLTVNGDGDGDRTRQRGGRPATACVEPRCVAESRAAVAVHVYVKVNVNDRRQTGVTLVIDPNGHRVHTAFA